MQLVYSFVQFFQYGVQMLLVFLVGICVHLDAECIAGQGAPKYRGIPCSGADGVSSFGIYTNIFKFDFVTINQ